MVRWLSRSFLSSHHPFNGAFIHFSLSLYSLTHPPTLIHSSSSVVLNILVAGGGVLLIVLVGVSPPLNPFLRTFSINGSIIIIIIILIFPTSCATYICRCMYTQPSQSLLNFQLFVFVRPNKCSIHHPPHILQAKSVS